METSRKYSARQLVGALCAYDVRDVVVSPGSRNTPIIIALEAEHLLRKHVVIDERSAAFVALGIALETGRPVACVCTSGSAVLNYAPAVAEAYYRGIPLIIVSADRPLEWIDQDDSQTLRQYGVLDNIVKGSFNIADVGTGPSWYADRMLNDALTLAGACKPGPVHINMEFTEPLGEMCPAQNAFKRTVCSGADYSEVLLPDIPFRKIMIVAGFHSPDAEYSKLLEALWKECGIPVLCEAQSNVVGISAAGSLKTMQDNPDIARRAEEYCPELVVSVGGSVLSKALKNYIRNSDGIREHWYIGYSDHAIDCYGRLSRRFNIDCKVFLRALYRKFMHHADVDYVNLWNTLSGIGETHIAGFINRLPWCGLKAVRFITDVCGSNDTSLHVSNGMAVRHVQFCDFQKWKSVECNRGVSGIDGSTSTAIGAALAGGRILLVSGDMSAQYDIGALAIDAVPDDFRMIVLDNCGGGIFRVIGSTENIDPTIRERYYSGNINLPLANLARAFGFGYFEVDSEESFRESCPDFLACDRKAIMRIVVD